MAGIEDVGGKLVGLPRFKFERQSFQDRIQKRHNSGLGIKRELSIAKFDLEALKTDSKAFKVLDGQVQSSIFFRRERDSRSPEG